MEEEERPKSVPDMGPKFGELAVESRELAGVRALGLTTVIITSHFPVLSPSLVDAFLPIIIIVVIMIIDCNMIAQISISFIVNAMPEQIIIIALF